MLSKKLVERSHRNNNYISGQMLLDAGIKNDSFGEIIEPDYYYCLCNGYWIRLVAIDSEYSALNGLINHIIKNQNNESNNQNNRTAVKGDVQP